MRNTPINLLNILEQMGTGAKARMRRTMMLTGGNAPSAATVSQLLHRGQYPARTPQQEIQSQITGWLRAEGIGPQAIATAFDFIAPAAGRRDEVTPITDINLPEADMLSQKTKQFFRIFKDPFIDDVQGPDDVFLSADQRYIREAMLDCARHGGFRAIVGESGAGKSVLRRDLIDRIRREDLPIVPIMPLTIDKSRLNTAHIAEAIIADISAESPKRTLEGKDRQIQRLLTGSSRAGHSHVLIIEEAHDLNTHTLKRLKRYWEMEDGFRRLLGIMLIGQPELKDKLNVRINWDAREVINRIEIAELQPLDQDLEQYLAIKFKRIGKELNHVFEDDAYDAIRTRLTIRQQHQSSTHSMVYPLMVNNVATKAMNLAVELGTGKVTADVVRGV